MKMQDLVGKYVCVRTFSAGVHVGFYQEREGQEVVLTDARRIWSWDGAFTLSEVSQKGINPLSSRISMAVPFILLTQAIEVMPVSEEAKNTIDLCKVWK
jgi:hypothetical protein